LSGLSGRRVLITRNPERAGALVSLLIEQGAEALVLPLIDFERLPETGQLDDALESLAAGAYDWLVISSSTTVRALEERASARRLPLGQLVPDGTRIAAVGTETARALEHAGLKVELIPGGSHSAAGLIGEWPLGGRSVLLPQADIAERVLAEGLAAKGAHVTTVVAYRTVDYPASPELRLFPAQGQPLALGAGNISAAGTEVGLAEARRLLSADSIDAVVAASPSAARRIAARLAPLGRCRFVAIGRSTAAAAREAGITVAAIAEKPTPAGIAAALSELFAIEGT
jgi:uroporphyrinogen-III synthase